MPLLTLRSPIHPLASNLADILATILGNTPSHVRNSSHFVELIWQTTIKDDVMVSFNIVSLVTKVSVDATLQVIARLLQEDASLTDRTRIPPGHLLDLIQLCLKSTYFHFRGTFYQQVQGAAMGSPLSTIVANPLYTSTMSTHHQP